MRRTRTSNLILQSQSRFNINREKLLQDAQKLREEAESLEKVNEKGSSPSVQITPQQLNTTTTTNTTTAATSAATNNILSGLLNFLSNSKAGDKNGTLVTTTVANKLTSASIFRDDFISNSAIADSNTITKTASNTSTITETETVSSGKPDSILISRSDVKRRQELIDKLSGVSSTKVTNSNAPINNAIESSKSVHQDKEKVLNAEDLRRLEALNYRVLMDFPTDNRITYICENKTYATDEIKKLKDEQYGLLTPWWFRMLTRTAIPQLVSNKVPEDFSDSLKFLAESAILKEFEDFREKEEKSNLDDIEAFLNEFFTVVDEKWKDRFYRLLKRDGYVLDEDNDKELIAFLAMNGSNSRKHSFPRLLDIEDSTQGAGSESEGSLLVDESVLNSTAAMDLLALYNDEIRVEVPKTAAERLIGEYFDKESRLNGMTISRDGAGRFQLEVLKDVFVVNGVSNSQGAFIFDGRPIEKDPEKFAKIVEDRFEKCSMRTDVNYTIIMNELYANFDKGLEQAAIDTLTGSSPAIIIYPQSWNSTISSLVSDPGKLLWRNILTYSTIFLSSVFASTLYSDTPAVGDDGFLEAVLVAVPITIPTLAQTVEVYVATLKRVNISWILMPTTNLFTYGARSIFLNMPKNRNDIFDIAAWSIGASFILSTITLFAGLALTVNAPPELLATFPVVPYALLRIDSLVSQLVSYELPSLSYISDPNALVHLHWLAVTGAFSLLGTTFQLIPLDNSAGSKMTFASVGRENFSLISLGVLLFKFGFIGLILLNFNSFFFSDVSVVSKQKFLFDYILVSQFCGDQSENQLAVDNLSELSEGRRFLFLGFITFFVFSFFPFAQITSLGESIISLFSSSSQSLF